MKTGSFLMAVTAGLLLFSMVSPNYFVPEDVVDDYAGWLVVDKQEWLGGFISLYNSGEEDIKHIQSSQLVFNTWAVGDTIKEIK